MRENAKVEIGERDSLDKALDILRKKLRDNDVWREWEDAQEYTPPSKQSRDQRHAAKQRNADEMQENQYWKAEQHKLD